MRQKLKDSLFFPDASFKWRNSLFCGIIISLPLLHSLFIHNEAPFHASTIIFFLGFYLLAVLEIWIISKVLTRQSYTNLEKLEKLIQDPSFTPILVSVKKTTIAESLSSKTNGRCVRSAIDTEGKRYTVEYNKMLSSTFQANLYKIEKGSFLFFTLNVVVPIEVEIKENLAS